VARSRTIVELFSSTLPSDELYAENALPGADVMSARSTEIPADPSTSLPGELNRRARIAGKSSWARSQTHLLERPIAAKRTAIDERAASPQRGRERAVASEAHRTRLPPSLADTKGWMSPTRY